MESQLVYDKSAKEALNASVADHAIPRLCAWKLEPTAACPSREVVDIISVWAHTSATPWVLWPPPADTRHKFLFWSSCWNWLRPCKQTRPRPQRFLRIPWLIQRQLICLHLYLESSHGACLLPAGDAEEDDSAASDVQQVHERLAKRIIRSIVMQNSEVPEGKAGKGRSFPLQSAWKLGNCYAVAQAPESKCGLLDLQLTEENDILVFSVCIIFWRDTASSALSKGGIDSIWSINWVLVSNLNVNVFQCSVHQNICPHPLSCNSSCSVWVPSQERTAAFPSERTSGLTKAN